MNKWCKCETPSHTIRESASGAFVCDLCGEMIPCQKCGTDPRPPFAEFIEDEVYVCAKHTKEKRRWEWGGKMAEKYNRDARARKARGIQVIGQTTIKPAWKSVFKNLWMEAIGRRWGIREYPHRCDFCGRRLGDDFIAAMNGGGVARICHYHGQYEGHKRIDCFTGCEVIQHKEPRFYHERAILHEAWFFIKAAFLFLGAFFRELPLNVLQAVNWVTRKAIEKQQERLGFK